MNKCVFSVALLFLLSFAAPLTLARSTLGIGIKVFERMQEAQLLTEQSRYEQAMTVVESLLAQRNLNNYERAQTLSLKGNIYFHQDNLRRARETFQAALAHTDLPDGFVANTVRTLAQVSFMLEDYQAALTYATRLRDMTPAADANTLMLIAQAHLRLENLKEALENANAAIRLEREAGHEVREGWLLIVSAIHHGRNDYAAMAQVLTELVSLYPRDRYILNLAAIYGQLERTERQLLLMEPLYDSGRLTREAELLNLANLMLLHNVPYKAALILEKGFKEGRVEKNRRNLELSAHAWQSAAEHEKALEYLAQAAELAPDGNTYINLAQGYMNLYRWADAEKVLEKALKKGKIAREGNVYVLLGMTRFYQKNYLAAHRTFTTAAGYDETQRLAEQWLAYIRQEQEKQAAVRGGAEGS